MRSDTAHTSRDFEAELRELRANLLVMAARSERIVGIAVDAFRRGESGLLRTVEELDAQIDADAIAIHGLTLRILALRQPVADDLRFLVTTLKLIVDLERVGDEAVNIGERAVEGDDMARSLVEAPLTTMCNDVRDMLRLALDALVNWDDEAALRVLAGDDAVDRECAGIIGSMTAHMQRGPCGVAAGLRVIRVAKYLERIADHATNVAEEVIFMVRADDVRHRHGPSPASMARAPS